MAAADTSAMISAGADLAASVDPNIFGDAPDTGDDTALETTDNPEVPEGSEPFTPPPEELEISPEVEQAAEQPKPAVAKPAEELPPGVERGKNRDGKPGMWVAEPRWKTLEEANRNIRAAENLLGERVTPEALDLRNRAFLGQERLYNDLLSGDPQAQSRLAGHLFDEAERARNSGEIADNPMVPFAQTFYSTLQQRDPDAFAALRTQAANDLVTEMYQEAGRTGNRNLWLSAGHIAKTLGMEFKTEAEMAQFAAGDDQATTLQRENQALKQELNGRQVTNAAAQFHSWRAQTSQSVLEAVRQNTQSAIPADIAKSWEKFPAQFKNLVLDPLHSAVKQTVESDRPFNERVRLLDQAAQRAPSAQTRAACRDQIKQLYVNRAALAVEAHKDQILASAAQIFKQQNAETHQRRQAAQEQRGPRGTEVTAPRSLVPKTLGNPGELFNSNDAVRQLQRLIG